MNNNELKNNIDQFNEENSSISLQLGHKENKNYLFLECEIDDKIQKEIVKLLKKAVNNIVKNNELVNFDPIGKQDGTIEMINTCYVDGYNILIKDREESTNFAQNIDELGEINFYILELENETNKIEIFRRYSKSKSLSKGLMFRSLASKLSKIKDNIFQVDNIVDFIVVNEERIIVFNRFSFEVITNYKDNYMENLDTALKEISNSNLINNIEKFEEDCKNSVRIAKQFTKAMQENSISLILEHLEQVSDAIREAELPIEFIDNKFEYDNKEQLSILVALLSDKYAKTLIGERITN